MKKAIKRKLIGQVVSTSMDKTISVRVDNKKMHPKYSKAHSVSKKYHVHDDKKAAKAGDKVTIVECRPLSKTKRWRLVEVNK